MSKRWKNTRASILLLLVLSLTACPPPIKKDAQYIYRFEPGKNLYYDVDLDIDATVDAMIFQYKGKIGMTGEIELSPVKEGTPYGTQLRMTLRGLDVQADDPRINAGMIMGMNYFRTYFSSLFLTDRGKTTVLFYNKPHTEFSMYASMVFPDFTDMDIIWAGEEKKTNITLKLREQSIVLKIEQEQSPARLKDNQLLIFRQHTVRLYQAKDFEKSVEPQELAAFRVDMDIVYDTVKQKIILEDADLDVQVSFPVQQGILQQNINASAKGKLIIKKREEPQT